MTSPAVRRRISGALPNGRLRGLAGEWHGVPDEELAPVVAGFFRS